MKSGDSLVHKIEKGIEESQAFLVVISQFSVVKPWVRHELDIGVVRMIEAKTRLIPIVIDDCDIPLSLQPLLQIRVKGDSAVQQAADAVVITMTGGREKPPLGQLPSYAAFTDFAVPGLTRIDNLVLKFACDLVMLKGHYSITGSEIWESVRLDGVPMAEFEESLEALTGKRLLKNTWPHGGVMHSIFAVSLHAFDEYLKRTQPDYALVSRAVAAEAANSREALNHEISSSLDLPLVIVNHIMLALESKRLLTLSKTMPNYIRISSVSVELKRALRQ